MSTQPLRALEQALIEEFARDARGKGVAKLLAAYSSGGHEDWRAYAHFEADHYTRNLVARHADYELIVLCWRAGQASPIHCHSQQQCWMAILDGQIEEQQYDQPVPGHAGPLTLRAARTYAQGKVAYIDDDIALHLVRPVAGRDGCSLHLYSKPIETCGIYDPATGAVQTRVMRYYSVGGVVQAR